MLGLRHATQGGHSEMFVLPICGPHLHLQLWCQLWGLAVALGQRVQLGTVLLQVLSGWPVFVSCGPLTLHVYIIDGCW